MFHWCFSAFVKDLFPVVANPDSGGGRRGGAKSNTAGAKIKVLRQGSVCLSLSIKRSTKEDYISGNVTM